MQRLQSISIVVTAFVIVSSLGVCTSIGQTLLPAASSKPFYEWLGGLPQFSDPNQPGYHFVQSARAVLEIPADGRQRFLMPRSRSTAKRLSVVLEQAFPNSEDRSKFQQFVQAIRLELETVAKENESRQQWDEAYRFRWLATGFAGLDPTSKAAWPPADDVLQPRRAPAAGKGSHPVTQWPASSYQLVTTPNFEIAFQAKQSDTSEISEICEQTYAVWKQMFFSYWSPANAGSPPYQTKAPRPFQVVIFSNKANYLKALQSQVSNISVSTGYYNQNVKACFFYLEDRRSYTTMVHELTHQFFIEATKQPILFDADQTAGFWAAEGVALHMESLAMREMGPSVLMDVGGWDSSRLQAGRFRFLRDQMWFPWDSFGAANGQRFRLMEDISPRYSQACGLAHFWMESNPTSQVQWKNHLSSLYLRGTPSALDPNDDELLMKSYLEHLRRGPRSSDNYLPFANRNELVLSRCDIDSAWLMRTLVSKRQWESLDVAFTKVDDTAWTTDGMDWDIVRLNIESTRVTDASIPFLANMPRLQELDLSNCKVSDKGTQELANHKTLKTLWLAGSTVTNSSLDILATIPKLEAVHVQGTAITIEEWQRFLKTVPRLKNKSSGPK